MPFRFRLEVPLRLARARRRGLRRDLAVALRELAAAERLLGDAEAHVARIAEEMSDAAGAGIRGAELHTLSQGRDRARARLPGLRAHRAGAAEREAALRAELAQAAQEVSVLDKLRHAARLEWQRDVARREQAAIDDVVLVRRARAAILETRP